MKSPLNRSERALTVVFLLAVMMLMSAPVRADSIPLASSAPLVWRIGAELSPAHVPGSNHFLRGETPGTERVNTCLSAAVRADFSYDPHSIKGKLWRGLYQGIALDMRTFFAGNMLGMPVSAYVYQGAPIVSFSSRLSLDYEWKFGAAFGWKHYDRDGDTDNTAVSTPVTAHMGIALRLRYRITPRLHVSVGAEATHFSNGNTSLPNAGVNSLGASVGVAWCLNPPENRPQTETPLLLPRTSRWFYDIVAFGGWRKRVVFIDGDPTLCHGTFGVAGIRFSPMRQFNQWVAAGLALDMQYDESAGLAPYAVDGTYGDDLRFYRPPFGRQLAIGVSANGELITPVFSVNAGFGVSLLCPEGDSRFYQSLTLKTFVTRSLFVNVGYRLGNFSEPQNLMLGLGIRL